VRVSGSISCSKVSSCISQKYIIGSISQKKISSCFEESGYTFTWPYLISLMRYLWIGYNVGNHLVSATDGRYITINNIDFSGNTIPESTGATFNLPADADFISDDTDNCWFTGGVQKNVTFDDLNDNNWARTVVLRPNQAPYNIAAIGLLKSTTVLTDAEREQLAEDFKLWLFWNEIN